MDHILDDSVYQCHFLNLAVVLKICKKIFFLSFFPFFFFEKLRKCLLHLWINNFLKNVLVLKRYVLKYLGMKGYMSETYSQIVQKK